MFNYLDIWNFTFSVSRYFESCFGGAPATEGATAGNATSYRCLTIFFRNYRGKYDVMWLLPKVRSGVRCLVLSRKSWSHVG